MNKISVAIIFIGTIIIAVYPKYKVYRAKHNVEVARQVFQEQGLPKIRYDVVGSHHKKQVSNDNGYPLNTTTIRVLDWDNNNLKEQFDKDWKYEYAEQIRFSVCQDVYNYFWNKYTEKKISRHNLNTYGKLFRDDKVAIHIVLEDKKGEEVLTSTAYFSECTGMQVLLYGN